MKNFALFCLLTIISSAPAAGPTVDVTIGEFQLAQVATSSETAAVLGDATLDLEDHYGNPDHFIRYIIRIPPVHA